tara:strand:+ start:885 stop:1745 length:861 start_codon:yes stop_codon:yes gene_type:complete
MIPKIIYVFWEGEMTVFVKACFDNIKRMNPGFEVKLLTSESIDHKPKNFYDLKVQAKSDWARVDAVSKTGGVWIDITSIVLKPFESWIDFESNIFHAFEVPFDCNVNVIESWAFAAPKDCPLVHAWKNEFEQAIESEFKTYNKENDKPECLKSWLPYLTIHQALHVARRKVQYKNVKIMKSTAKNMPYNLISQCKWDGECFIKKLKNENDLNEIFLKFNGSLTKQFSKVIRKMNFIEKLFIHNFSHIERTLMIRIGENSKTYNYVLVMFFILICFYRLFTCYMLSK